MIAPRGARVTVFIPTYNRAHWLRQSVESVLAQTYEDMLLVVADNASTDDTPDLVASYADPRVVHVRREENVGVVGNYRQCFESVSTDYAIFLSDDDVLLPEHLESTIRLLDKHPRVGMVHTAFDVIDAEGAVRRAATNWTGSLARNAIEPGLRFIEESMAWSNRVCLSTAVIRREAIRPDSFAQNSSIFDFSMWLRMALDWDMAFLAAPLAQYRIHSSSETAAFGPAGAQGYVQGAGLVKEMQEIKLRFLDSHRATLGDTERLGRLARRTTRRHLVGVVRNTTVPQRKLLPTLRLLADVVGLDRRILLEPSAWRVLLGSVIGGRGVANLKKLRRNARARTI